MHEMEMYVAVVIFHLETATDILVIPVKLYNAVFGESLIFQAKFEYLKIVQGVVARCFFGNSD